MINTKTVLVLGAGASAPYKFPTGTQLVRQIREFAGSPQAEGWLRACDLWVTRYHAADRTDFLSNVAGRMRSLSLELKECDPASIDQFLELRQDMAEAGILVISILLLEAEQKSEEHLWSDETKGHWYSLLKQQLANPPEQLGQDQLRVISFNYDRSLEHYLFRSLKPFYAATLEDKVYANAVQQISSLHIYGSLGPLPLPWQSNPGDVPYGAQGYGEVLTAAKNVRVLHQGAEDNVQQNFRTAQEWLQWADRVLFLGFGFHEDNVKRLDFTKVFPNPKRISGTSMRLNNTCRCKVEYCTSWAKNWEHVTNDRHIRPTIRFPDDDADCYDFLYRYADLS